MAKILVLGAGVMGSAITVPIADCGHQVHLVGTHLDRAIIDHLRTTGEHPKLKAPLNDGLSFYHDAQLDDAMALAPDLIVLGVSSAGVDWALGKLRPYGLKAPVIMLTKGLDALRDRIEIYPRRLSHELGVPVGGIGGPCIAGELAVRRQTSVVVGFDDLGLARAFADMFSAPYYHIRPTDDLVGLELCAALKNFMALGIGAAQGWLDVAEPAVNEAMAHNVAAGLFSQAVRELQILNAALGGTDEAIYGLPGVGDLYVTVQGGRNSRMGRLLGAGWHYRDAKYERMKDDTVEGAELALHVGPTLRQLMVEGAIDRHKLPLTNAILDSIVDNRPFDIQWPRFHRNSEA